MEYLVGQCMQKAVGYKSEVDGKFSVWRAVGKTVVNNKW